MEKEIIEKQHFEGERALFKITNAEITNCVFDNGESPLKESKNLKIKNCTFGWKYPLWYGEGFEVRDCLFLETARAGIWYTKDSTFKHLTISAPKTFRHSEEIVIEDVRFENAAETLWWCFDITLKNSFAKGPYLFMQSKDVLIDHLELEGDYAFDGGENIHIKNSVLHTKDAFWNCKNVLVEDSEIDGEYFGWNSENVTLIRCKIKSHQGFCYMKNVKLVDCDIEGSDLTFEYCSDIDAKIISSIESVKNPLSGKIKAKGIKDIIRDDSSINHNNTLIEVLNDEGEYHAV